MPAPITLAAALVKALIAHGTGEAKIKFCRSVLAASPRASSTELIAAMEANISISDLTIEKAKQLAYTGRYDPKVVKIVEPNIEDTILAEMAAEEVLETVESKVETVPPVPPVPPVNDNKGSANKSGAAGK